MDVINYRIEVNDRDGAIAFNYFVESRETVDHLVKVCESKGLIAKVIDLTELEVQND